MSSITHTAPGGGPSATARAAGGGPRIAVASSTTTTVVLLLTAPALLWGILLFTGLAFDLPELGSFANPVVGALGIVSTLGLVSATGVALTSRVAARRPARFSGRSGRRALIVASAALVGGGMLVAGVTALAPVAAERPAPPAVEQPASPAAPVEAPLFGVDHSDH